MYDFCCRLKHLLVGILFHNLRHPYIPLHFEEMIFPLVKSPTRTLKQYLNECLHMHSFTCPLSLRKNAGSTFYRKLTMKYTGHYTFFKITKQKIKAVSYYLNECLHMHSFSNKCSSHMPTLIKKKCWLQILSQTKHSFLSSFPLCPPSSSFSPYVPDLNFNINHKHAQPLIEHFHHQHCVRKGIRYPLFL